MATRSNRTANEAPRPVRSAVRRRAALRTALRNAVPLLVLRTPLVHRLMSGRYLVLDFAGRVSGRRYTLPVAYVADGDRLLISTDSRWWRNIAGGQPLRVGLRGGWRQAAASRLTDRLEAASALRRLVDEVPGYAGPAGLPVIDGRVPESAVTAAVAGDARVVLAVVPAPAPAPGSRGSREVRA